MRSKELFEKLNAPNDGTRTLMESILVPEVMAAFKDWIQSASVDAVLIGGLAVSFYIKPRTTTDIDLLFLDRSQIPLYLDEFRKIRPSAFRHKKTHVEVETLAPETINQRPEIVHMVFNTALESDGVKIASPSGLVALKLARFSYQDMADIELLIATGRVDMTDWPLNVDEQNKLSNFY